MNGGTIPAPPGPVVPAPHPLQATLSLQANEDLGAIFSAAGQTQATSYDAGQPEHLWIAPDAMCNIEAAGTNLYPPVENVTITASYVLNCVNPKGLVQRQEGAFSQTGVAQAGVAGPVKANLDFKIQDYIQCQAGYVCQSIDLDLYASATTGVNAFVHPPAAETIKTPSLHLRSGDAAPVIRVATFNVANDQDAMQHDTEAKLQRFGHDLLSQADIVFLQEVRTKDWLTILGDAAGLQYRYGEGTRCVGGWGPPGSCWGGYWYTDVAILSRYPFATTPSHQYIGDQKLIDARLSINGGFYRLLAVHPWPAGGGHDQDRADYFNTLYKFAAQEPGMLIVGGDFNSGLGDPEHARLNDLALVDSYDSAVELHGDFPDKVQICPNARDPGSGDWIFIRNAPYMTTKYDGCQNSEPSDHLCVLATFGRVWWLR